ncbi:hypothetical protein [Pleionea sp. CnH1-48]|uniref:hypothetical protein n=1 Tax=Pleionea sp. CnH1-48 TaxID=2954494 RepID=UPI00209842CB|nr:hypothetical protein [Pleionea sp. CnH1-48]MCO7223761.1 hypothetical protein [Pleionea sp. CnH1-48]
MLPFMAMAEKPISFIEVFGGNYELPKYCMNYAESEDAEYNIHCEPPTGEYLISIRTSHKPCIEGSEIKPPKFELTREFISNELRFLEIKGTNKRTGHITYLRYISSENRCLTLVARSLDYLNMVKIGNW